MTLKTLCTLVLFAGAALFAANATAQNTATKGNAAQGKIKSETCLGCHGIPGYQTMYPSYAVPKLAGQHKAYIIAALKDYKAGKRDFATMHAQASELSQQDMKDIAAYFSSLGQKYAPADDSAASNTSQGASS